MVVIVVGFSINEETWRISVFLNDTISTTRTNMHKRKLNSTIELSKNWDRSEREDWKVGRNKLKLAIQEVLPLEFFSS